MDAWAKATQKDREALFNQTASVKGISPEIAEKDFWVCWTLHQIFNLGNDLDLSAHIPIPYPEISTSACP